MKKRSFDEMIAYFNRRVADMDISQDCKMELLGMVTALEYKHEKTAHPEHNTWERKKEANEPVRSTLRMRNKKQWELAQALGIAEATLSRKLRTELPVEEQTKMIKLIENMAGYGADLRGDAHE